MYFEFTIKNGQDKSDRQCLLKDTNTKIDTEYIASNKKVFPKSLFDNRTIKFIITLNVLGLINLQCNAIQYNTMVKIKI